MLTEDEWQLVYPVIDRAAKITASRMPGVEYDELWSALAEFAAKASQDHLKYKLDPHNEDHLRYVLFRAARIEAAKMRAEAYENVTQYDYCTDDVKSILPYAIGDPERWYQAPAPYDDDSMHRSDSHRVDGVLDVLAALEELSYDNMRCIYAWHMDGDVHAANTSGRQRYNRAVQKLTRYVNKAQYQRLAERTGHPGARKAESNVKSQARIEQETSFIDRRYDRINQEWV